MPFKVTQQLDSSSTVTQIDNRLFIDGYSYSSYLPLGWSGWLRNWENEVSSIVIPSLCETNERQCIENASKTIHSRTIPIIEENDWLPNYSDTLVSLSPLKAINHRDSRCYQAYDPLGSPLVTTNDRLPFAFLSPLFNDELSCLDLRRQIDIQKRTITLPPTILPKHPPKETNCGTPLFIVDEPHQVTSFLNLLGVEGEDSVLLLNREKLNYSTEEILNERISKSSFVFIYSKNPDTNHFIRLLSSKLDREVLSPELFFASPFRFLEDQIPLPEDLAYAETNDFSPIKDLRNAFSNRAKRKASQTNLQQGAKSDAYSFHPLRSAKFIESPISEYSNESLSQKNTHRESPRSAPHLESEFKPYLACGRNWTSVLTRITDGDRISGTQESLQTWISRYMTTRNSAFELCQFYRDYLLPDQDWATRFAQTSKQLLESDLKYARKTTTIQALSCHYAATEDWSSAQKLTQSSTSDTHFENHIRLHDIIFNLSKSSVVPDLASHLKPHYEYTIACLQELSEVSCRAADLRLFHCQALSSLKRWDDAQKAFSLIDDQAINLQTAALLPFIVSGHKSFASQKLEQIDLSNVTQHEPYEQWLCQLVAYSLLANNDEAAKKSIRLWHRSERGYLHSDHCWSPGFLDKRFIFALILKQTGRINEARKMKSMAKTFTIADRKIVDYLWKIAEPKFEGFEPEILSHFLSGSTR